MNKKKKTKYEPNYRMYIGKHFEIRFVYTRRVQQTLFEPVTHYIKCNKNQTKSTKKGKEAMKEMEREKVAE